MQAETETLTRLMSQAAEILRQGRGPWAGLLEYRVRTLEAA
jgi:hypothetical protein